MTGDRAINGAPAPASQAAAFSYAAMRGLPIMQIGCGPRLADDSERAEILPVNLASSMHLESTWKMAIGELFSGKLRSGGLQSWRRKAEKPKSPKARKPESPERLCEKAFNTRISHGSWPGGMRN